MTELDVDLVLVGAGPVGLYGAYYAGVRGRDLVDGLVVQAGQYDPHYVFGEAATTVERQPDGRLLVGTDAGTLPRCRALVLTGGIGTFRPRPLPTGEFPRPRPRVRRAAAGRPRRCGPVIVGGGDSALDWTLALLPIARSVTLVHRRKAFRGHRGSVQTVLTSGAHVLTDAEVTRCWGPSRWTPSRSRSRDTRCRWSRVSGSWPRSASSATSARCAAGASRSTRTATSSSTPTCAAASPGSSRPGTSPEYDGKVRLISVGFGEVATAVNNAVVELDPAAALDPGHSTDRAPVPVPAS